jgi:hypothetical protein
MRVISPGTQGAPPPDPRRPYGPNGRQWRAALVATPAELEEQQRRNPDEQLLPIAFPKDPDPFSSEMLQPSSALIDAMRGRTQAQLQGAGEMQRMAEENARKLSEQALMKMAPRAMMQIMSGRKIDTTRARKVQELALMQAMRAQEIAERRKLLEVELPAQEAVDIAQYQDQFSQANAQTRNADARANFAARQQAERDRLGALERAGQAGFTIEGQAIKSHQDELDRVENTRRWEAGYNLNARQLTLQEERAQQEAEDRELARLQRTMGGDLKFWTGFGTTLTVLRGGVATRGRFVESGRGLFKGRSRTIATELKETGRGLGRLSSELASEYNEYRLRLAQQGAVPTEEFDTRVRRLQASLASADEALKGKPSPSEINAVWRKIEQDLRELDLLDPASTGRPSPEREAAQGTAEQPGTTGQAGTTGQPPASASPKIEQSYRSAEEYLSTTPAPAQAAPAQPTAAATRGVRITREEAMRNPEAAREAANRAIGEGLPIITEDGEITSRAEVSDYIRAAPGQEMSKWAERRDMANESVAVLRGHGLTNPNRIGADPVVFQDRPVWPSLDRVQIPVTVNNSRIILEGRTMEEVEAKRDALFTAIAEVSGAIGLGSSFERGTGSRFEYRLPSEIAQTFENLKNTALHGPNGAPGPSLRERARASLK